MLLFYRSSHRYEATRDDQAVLRMRNREIAEVRVRYGYYRIYILLRREGWKVNHKRVYRLYRKEVSEPAQEAAATARERCAAGGTNRSGSCE